MRFLLIFLSCLIIIYAQPISKDQAHVDYINSQNKWAAKLNPRFSDPAKLKQLMGARKEFKSTKLIKVTSSGETNDEIPKEFDARKHWPKCKHIIEKIVDQSECGSCWAVSVASSISDRLCIASQGQIQTFISAFDIMSCCSSCGFGCNGGFVDEVFDQWSEGGFVTGSDYVQDKGCMPYPFAPCQHHGMFYANSSLPVCPSTYYNSPKCVKKCQKSYKPKYEEDKFYGQPQIGLFQDVKAIQNEIMKEGSVVATYMVFEDFTHYSSGVYEKLSGSFIGFHAVRLIGWGTENSTDFWLAANSWNEFWGEKGWFKIRRGTNECGIESQVIASIPDINRSAKLYID